MTFNASNIAIGTSLLGGGVLAGVLLAPHDAESRRTVAAVPPAPVVRTVHIKRVHHRTVHERVHHQRLRAAVPTPAAVVPAATPVRLVSAAPPAPVRHELRTRTSGSGGGGGHEAEHEHEGGGDD
jgi:hypothetical protein